MSQQDPAPFDIGPIPSAADDFDDPEPAPISAQPERRRPGRPRKVPDPPPPAVDANPDPEGAQRRVIEQELKVWREPCPVDRPEAAWHWILAHIHERGWEPHQVQIAVIRLTAVPGQGAPKPTYLDPRIRGDQVMGDPENGFPAGEAIRYWVIDYYHRHPGVYGSYKLQFLGPDGEHIAITQPFPLEKWSDLEARRRALESAGTSTSAPPVYGRRAPAGFVPSAPGAPVGGDAAIHEELGYLRALVSERAQAAAEGRAPRDLGPPPVALGAASAQSLEYERQLSEMKLQGEKQKAEHAMALMRMEFDMKLAALKAPAVDDVGSAVVKTLMALGIIGPDGKPVGAAATPISPMASPAEQLAEAAKIIVEQRTKGEEAEKSLRKLFGFQDTSTELVKDEPDEKPSSPWWVEQLKAVAQGIVKNPEVALGVAGGLVGEASPAGQFISTTAKTIAAAKAASRAATSVPMNPGQSGPYKPPSA